MGLEERHPYETLDSVGVLPNPIICKKIITCALKDDDGEIHKYSPKKTSDEVVIL